MKKILLFLMLLPIIGLTQEENITLFPDSIDVEVNTSNMVLTISEHTYSHTFVWNEYITTYDVIDNTIYVETERVRYVFAENTYKATSKLTNEFMIVSIPKNRIHYKLKYEYKF